MSWIQELDEVSAHRALQFVRELNVISLSRFRVVGDYVRYDDAIRNQLKNLKQKITNGIRAQTRGQENYLIWGPQGSGKSHFARQLAKSFGAAVRYIELNLADLKENDFREALASLEDADRPVLCFIDEIDCKLAEQWSCEVLLPYLEPRASQKFRVCFILAGSGGSDMAEFKKIISARPKGKDILSRIPYGNEFTVPPLGIGDRIVVALSNLMVAAKKSHVRLREVDKLALLYIVLNPHLSEARKIGQLAVAALNRIPKGEDRLLYDNLFDLGSTERMEFWQRWREEGLFNSMVAVEYAQDQEQVSESGGYYEGPWEVERVFGKEIEEKALLCQIDSSEALYRVARDSNFMQNRMGDFQEKIRRIIYFDEQKTYERIRNLADKLTPQTIVFITGPPAVGKSTFMLYFLEICLRQNIGSWRRVFFINPSEDYLEKTLESGLIQKLLGKDALSSDDALLIIDGLYRGEPNEEEKVFRLFRHVREKGYRLLVTIRSHELDELKKKLGRRWAALEGDMLVERLEPNKEIVRPVIKNLLKEKKSNFLRFRDLSEHELEAFFADVEFEEIIKIIREKSNGLVGYLNYLMDDLSKNGEFSKEAVLKYPEGLASLIQKIIERDYLLDGEEVLPTIILLLAEDYAPLSYQLIKSFTTWGVREIDKASPSDSLGLESSILSKVSELLANFALSKKENEIMVYRLNAHWKQAIKDFSSTNTEWIRRRNHLKSNLNHFFSEIQVKLTRGELIPEPGDDVFVVIADIAQISGREEMLKLAKEFLKQYVRSNEDRTLQSSFLANKLVTILLRNAQELINQRKYKKALESVEEGLEIASNNADLNYLASRCHRALGEIDPDALEHCKKALTEVPNSILYNEEMGHVLRLKGEILQAQGKSSLAVITFGDALRYYSDSLKIIEKLNRWERGAKRAQENRLRWHIGRCRRRIAMIEATNLNWSQEKANTVARSMLDQVETCKLQGDYVEALKILEMAKKISFRFKNNIEELTKVVDIIRQLYFQCGICYEKTGNFSKAALNYLIYAKLDEYGVGSAERYVEIGDKLLQWGFHAMAHHLFHRAFRKDPKNLSALMKMIFTEEELGRIDIALDNARKALQMGIPKAGFQQSIVDLIRRCQSKLKIRNDIGDKILRIMNLAITNQTASRLSDEWYSAGMALGEIDPKDIALPKDTNNQECLDQIIDEINEAKILCLWRAWRLNPNNSKAKYEAENLTGQSYEIVERECEKKFKEYFDKLKGDAPALPFLRSPVSEILLHTCFRAIGTERLRVKISYKKLTDKEAKRLIKLYSSFWGWLGARIRSLYRDKVNPVKICPRVAVKSFELSLYFNPKNRASSNGYAWALFDAREYDKALEAFSSDIDPWYPSGPNANPAAKTGAAMVYMKKGELNSALQGLTEGARLRYEDRYNEIPERVLTQLAQTVESLKEAACTFPDFEKEILKEALRVYEMIKQVLNEIEIQPSQSEQFYLDNPNLLFLESISLREYLPQEYMNIFEAEQLSILPEIDTEISVQKTEDRSLQVSQSEPRDLEMLPDRPFTNLNRIEELIKELKGSVQLLDKDFGIETLKFLRQIDASAVKEIFILGGRSRLGTDLKEKCRAFIDEMRNKGIVVEIRILDAKDAQEIHDRYLIADGVAYNTPPWNIIHKKLGDIKYIPNFWFKRSIFNKYWSRATDISRATP
jgi:tetratricopeptide (TPR) repeat protein